MVLLFNVCQCEMLIVSFNLVQKGSDKFEHAILHLVCTVKISRIFHQSVGAKQDFERPNYV